MSKSNRRIGVVINFGSLLTLLAFFFVAKFGGGTIITVVGMSATLIAIIISFIYVFAKTGLWRLVHTKVDKLDERQVLITHESLRYSYSIFSIICLIVILTSELLKEFVMHGINIPLVPVFAVLLYLAHTLPASIIAWKEKEV
jgi:hypothetical protein